MQKECPKCKGNMYEGSKNHYDVLVWVCGTCGNTIWACAKCEHAVYTGTSCC